MVHRERQPTPPLPVARHLSAPAPKVLAGHRTDKGKSVVSWTSGHHSSINWYARKEKGSATHWWCI
ncbi:hypothetical protein NC653_031937 [Populus alba x Populus x berolinensis]|uniref:Uncharacterized protein n=1 Tax=Populus alba x Populus x berolinensis TaxID=444605 RepID=A0AAD6M0R4_9ROSI|nr:hypothetical protein NC653_031937 [Populus alba x Populus x berolinensis]